MSIIRHYLNVFLLLLLSVVAFASCTKDIMDLTGDITGTVRNKKDNSFVEGCIVTLTPSNNSTTTSIAGVYSFSDLDVGNYTLAFEKVGYEPATQTVSVATGDVKACNVFLTPIEEGIIVNPGTLNFGDLETTMELYISKSSLSGSAVAYTISTDAECISVSPNSGTLSEAQQTIKVIVDRSMVSTGDYSKKVTVSSSYGKVEVPVLFQKVETSVPKVSNNGDFYDITETSFKVDGLIVGTGGLQITNYGHCWSLSENPTINDNRTMLGNIKEVGAYTSTVTNGISAGKTYYVRAYATNSMGTSYSDQQTINIPKMTAPVVKTEEATSITKNTAVLNGLITENGGGDITECGFYYGKTENPTTKKALSSNDNATLQLVLTELSEGTEYYYKAYAKNSKGESWGEIKSFTTKNEVMISIQTNPATNISVNSATLNGSILDEGSQEITERGFYFGRTNNPTTQKRILENSTSLTYNVSDLEGGTTYYYKSYAKNSKGEVCGNLVSFTTLEERAPVVETLNAEKITYNSAQLKGFISDKGTSDIKSCGFYYGTSVNPTNRIESDSSDGEITCNLSNLTPGTKYYYKAFAKNQVGEACGEIKNFTPEYDKICYKDLFISDIPVYIQLPDDSKKHEYEFSYSSKIDWEVERSTISLTVSPMSGSSGNGTFKISANSAAIRPCEMTVTIKSGDQLIGVVKVVKSYGVY